ncbi:unnamed protein product [Ambrosiozyma monospora]|uniref:Unnamed protein product n=1 Tax=Ambrosiozyma monospora TaxID=43982 RepID=A0ACB5T7F9_AMBMO|nr:unnamed protein product [Ambrosiozyma monospora]
MKFSTALVVLAASTAFAAPVPQDASASASSSAPITEQSADIDPVSKKLSGGKLGTAGSVFGIGSSLYTIGSAIKDWVTGDDSQQQQAAQKRDFDFDFDEFQKRAVASAPKPATGGSSGSSGSSGSKLQNGANTIGIGASIATLIDSAKNWLSGDDTQADAPQASQAPQ